MEILDIVDRNGEPTGEQIDRETAHKNGIRHRTSHLWVARINKKHSETATLSDVQLLLQKRSDNKDSHPGKLDISSAGHIPAGTGYETSAVRELKEELGIDAKEEELHYCGKRRKEYKKKFHDSVFWDNQVSNVYVIMRNIEAEDVKYQLSELSGVMWMPFDEVYSMVEADSLLDAQGDIINTKSCIALEEMNMLKKYVEDNLEQLETEQNKV